MDFLLFASYITAEALLVKNAWKSAFSKGRVSLAQNFRQKGHPPQTIFSWRKLNYRMLDLSYVGISFFRFVTIHAFDGRTDGLLIARLRCMKLVINGLNVRHILHNQWYACNDLVSRMLIIWQNKTRNVNVDNFDVHRRSQDFVWWVHFSSTKKLTTIFSRRP